MTTSPSKDPYTTLLMYGAATCSITALLAYLGNYRMRLAVLAGAVLAYGIVKRRRVYPFARILAASPAPVFVCDRENQCSGLEGYKSSLGGVMLLWLAVLAGISLLSILVPVVHVPALSRPELIDRITHVSRIASSASTFLPQAQRSMAIEFFTALLQTFDAIVLLTLSLFFSVTGSACLYWFFIHRMDTKKQKSFA